MNDRTKILMFLSLGLMLFLMFSGVLEINPRNLATDSGFDSSYDSGSSSSSSSSSGSSYDSSDSDGSGSSIASDEAIIYKQYFPNGFNLVDYFNFLFSIEYFEMLLTDAIFHTFVMGMFLVYLATVSIEPKKSTCAIVYGLSLVPYILFPNIILVCIEFIGIFVFAFIKSPKRNKTYNASYNIDKNEIDLTEYGIDKDKIHKEIYDIYVRVQNAWSDFKLEDVSDILGDELLNMYKSQLSTLKIKKQKNVMSDFQYVDCIIKKVEEKSGTRVITAILQVDCKDYIIDSETGNVLRGNKNYINHYTYSLIFEESGANGVDRCPNCNAKLNETGQSVECEYCHSIVNRKSGNLVLIKKSMIDKR